MPAVSPMGCFQGSLETRFQRGAPTVLFPSRCNAPSPWPRPLTGSSSYASSRFFLLAAAHPVGRLLGQVPFKWAKPDYLPGRPVIWCFSPGNCASAGHAHRRGPLHSAVIGSSHPFICRFIFLARIRQQCPQTPGDTRPVFRVILLQSFLNFRWRGNA